MKQTPHKYNLTKIFSSFTSYKVYICLKKLIIFINDCYLFILFLCAPPHKSHKNIYMLLSIYYYMLSLFFFLHFLIIAKTTTMVRVLIEYNHLFQIWNSGIVSALSGVIIVV